jgi:hypothetical protein
MNVLECSSKGDKRFSAFYAHVTMWNVEASIEEHYQLCKRFETPYGVIAPKTIKEAKGRQPIHIELNHKEYSTEFLTPYYKMLWLRYLDIHPELVTHALQFDGFNDMFKGKSINCQADVVRQYIKQGRDSVWQDCLPLWNLFS